MKTKPLRAIIVEHSDDCGQTWEIGGIHFTVESAAKESREIPWKCRLRYVNLSDSGEFVTTDEIRAAECLVDQMERIFDQPARNQAR